MTDPQLDWDNIPTPDAPLRARSLGEAVLYLRVRGAVLLASRYRERDGQLTVAAQHHGALVLFSFQVREAGEPDPLWLGGSAPSTLLDPADLVLFASRIERELASPPDLQLAAEAVAEALKFIPPGQQHVPRECLCTAAARRLYDLDPDRFSRRRLLALADRLLRRST
jgi:hypothetical protein